MNHRTFLFICFAVLVFVVACTMDEIAACGRACAQSQQKMLKYNQTEGCVCGQEMQNVHDK